MENEAAKEYADEMMYDVDMDDDDYEDRWQEYYDEFLSK
jgi:hypothetical protein